MSCPDKTNSQGNYLHPEIEILATPFKHIALAMSGGGFRAGTFSLGVLSYLKQVSYFDANNPTQTLLENVTYLSSASGGTITTSTYALSVATGQDFNSYYAFMNEGMNGNVLVEKALELLNNKEVWFSRPGKERNIINSFALAYDELLLDRQKVAALKINPTSHLEEVCFNTTEFYNGLLFRQSIKLKPDSNTGDQEQFLYGNYKLHLDHDVAENLYLSDILAASSCFPGGFEPIVFPSDFTDQTTTKRKLLNGLHVTLEECNWSELNRMYGAHVVERIYNSMKQPVDPANFIATLKKEPIQDHFRVSFMDGGITDNQGLESMVQANKRRASGCSNFQPFDLMMVCDVDSHYIPPFETPQKTNPGFWTIYRYLTLFWSLLGISLTAFLLIIFKVLFDDQPIVQGIFGTLSGSMILISLFLLYQVYNTKKRITRQVNGSGIGLDEIFGKHIRDLLFKFFGRVPLSRLTFLLKVRVTSLLYISSNVFMARIRYLLYEQFFDQNNLKRTGRVKSNHIYDLAFSNDCNREGKYTTEHIPSKTMQAVAEYAMNMPTTLWFSQDGQHRKMQAAITACGQFTTCYNLLDYIWKLKIDYTKLHDKVNNLPDQLQGEAEKQTDRSVYGQLSKTEQKRVDAIETVLKNHFEHFKSNPFWLYNQLGEQSGIRDFYPVDSSIYRFPEEFEGLR